jgi:hypothetical protein
VLKYSRNTPLNKILLEQSKESGNKDGLSKEIKNRKQEHGFELWSEDILGEIVKWRVER